MEKEKHRGHGDPTAFAFAPEGASVGCLLVHGLTGSPAEMRLLGEYLYSRGVRVEAPLLPGHGTTPEDLNRVTWQDWLETAEAALDRLFQAGCIPFAAGLSLGSLIVLELAARHPEMGGIILYAPPLKVKNKLAPLAPLLRHVVHAAPKGEDSDFSDPEAAQRIWHYDCWPSGGVAEFWKFRNLVRRRLSRITVPVLIFHSTQDATVAPDAGEYLYHALGSKDKELILLHHSGHVMTVDAERELIFAQTYGFILAHLPRPVRSQEGE